MIANQQTGEVFSQDTVKSPSDNDPTKSLRTARTVQGSSIVKIKGLPYTATAQEVHEFFKDFEVKSVSFVREADGRPSGLAFVEFPTEQDAIKALSLNGRFVGDRFVKLLHVSRQEMEDQVRWGTIAIPGYQGNSAHGARSRAAFMNAQAMMMHGQVPALAPSSIVMLPETSSAFQSASLGPGQLQPGSQQGSQTVLVVDDGSGGAVMSSDSLVSQMDGLSLVTNQGGPGRTASGIHPDNVSIVNTLQNPHLNAPAEMLQSSLAVQNYTVAVPSVSRTVSDDFQHAVGQQMVQPHQQAGPYVRSGNTVRLSNFSQRLDAMVLQQQGGQQTMPGTVRPRHVVQSTPIMTSMRPSAAAPRVLSAQHLPPQRVPVISGGYSNASEGSLSSPCLSSGSVISSMHSAATAANIPLGSQSRSGSGSGSFRNGHVVLHQAQIQPGAVLNQPRVPSQTYVNAPIQQQASVSQMTASGQLYSQQSGGSFQQLQAIQAGGGQVQAVLTQPQYNAAPVGNMMIKVRGLPVNMDPNSVVALFQGYATAASGVMLGVDVQGCFSGEVWVRFVGTQEAARACAAFNGAVMSDGSVLYAEMV